MTSVHDGHSPRPFPRKRGEGVKAKSLAIASRVPGIDFGPVLRARRGIEEEPGSFRG
jgi:hypothetical protein